MLNSILKQTLLPALLCLVGLLFTGHTAHAISNANPITLTTSQPNTSQARTSLTKDQKRQFRRELRAKKKELRQQLIAHRHSAPKETFPKQRVHALAITGLICAILGIFLFGVLLGTLAIVFGIIALSAIKRNPELYRGNNLAVIDIVIGAIATIGALIVISTTQR